MQYKQKYECEKIFTCITTGFVNKQCFNPVFQIINLTSLNFSEFLTNTEFGDTIFKGWEQQGITKEK